MIVDCTPELLHAVYPWFQAGRDLGRWSDDDLWSSASMMSFGGGPWFEAATGTARLELDRRRELEAP